MKSWGNTWGIVLAAGEGSRLRSLTDRAERPAPKQFCSLRGERSLFAESIRRASRAVPRTRIRAVVAEQHRAFWEPEGRELAPDAFVVQPANRGTAAGILLPLLHVLEEDPLATVIVVPSDHHVEDERLLAGCVRRAARAVTKRRADLVLVGIRPDQPEPSYGWIQSEEADGGLRAVTRFVEKPSPPDAEQLFAQGAVWNSFLFAAHGPSLLASFRARLPESTAALEGALEGPRRERERRLEAAYAELRSEDFSRRLLAGREDRLRLVIAPECGWTDLGTPERVRACLARRTTVPPTRAPRSPEPNSVGRVTSFALLQQLATV